MKVSKSTRKITTLEQGGSVSTPALDAGMKDRDFNLPFMLNITTPKITPQETPLETEIILPMGRINKIWVEFPKGCSGLVGFQLWRNPNQIFPLPPGQWMRGDNFLVGLLFTHFVVTEPFTFTVRSYNLDDTYQHRIMLILEMSGINDDLPGSFGSFLQTLKGG